MSTLKTHGDLFESCGWTGALVQVGLFMGQQISFTILPMWHGPDSIIKWQLAGYISSPVEGLRWIQQWPERSGDLGRMLPWKRCVMSTSPFLVNHPAAGETDDDLRALKIKEANFLLYTDALTKNLPWYFALGDTQYARWIPVHFRDMITWQILILMSTASFMKENLWEEDD